MKKMFATSLEHHYFGLKHLELLMDVAAQLLAGTSAVSADDGATT